jgi:hypothetical protein
VAHHKAARFKLFQSRGENFVAGPARGGRQLAEPEGARLQHVQDQRVPRASEYVNRALKGLALGINGLGHRDTYSLTLSKGKALDKG